MWSWASTRRSTDYILVVKHHGRGWFPFALHAGWHWGARIIGVGAERREAEGALHAMWVFSRSSRALPLRGCFAGWCCMRAASQPRGSARRECLPALSTWKWPDLPNSSTVQWVRVALSGLEKEILGDQLSIIWLTESTRDGRHSVVSLTCIIALFSIFMSHRLWLRATERERERSRKLLASQLPRCSQKSSFLLLATERVCHLQRACFLLLGVCIILQPCQSHGFVPPPASVIRSLTY